MYWLRAYTDQMAAGLLALVLQAVGRGQERGEVGALKIVFRVLVVLWSGYCVRLLVMGLA